jgi:hypothetical protein
MMGIDTVGPGSSCGQKDVRLKAFGRKAWWNDCVYASRHPLQPASFLMVIKPLKSARATARRRKILNRLIERENWIYIKKVGCFQRILRVVTRENTPLFTTKHQHKRLRVGILYFDVSFTYWGNNTHFLHKLSNDISAEK